MKKKVSVMIGGRVYTLVAEEDEDSEQTRRIANYVNEKVSTLMEEGLSASDATVLAAVNIANDYFEQNESAEALRAQMKDYVEESAKARAELSELRRELARIKREYLDNN